MAWRNVKRAENTIKFVKPLTAPIWFSVDENIDLDAVVKRIYVEADRAEIRIAYDGLSLATEIREELMDKIRDWLAAFHTKNDSLFRLCWDRNAHIFPPRHCNRHLTVIRDLQL